MKRSLLEQILLYDYRYIIAYTVLIATALMVHFWRLDSLLPGLSHFEAEYVASLDWASLIDNPLFWPHKALTLALAGYAAPSAFWLRLVSVLFAFGAVTLFFFLVRNRFKDRVAIIAVGLLVTSSWWLHYARLARPEILIPFAIFAIMLLAKKAQETSHWLWLFALALAVGMSLYIPVMPYVILLGAFVTRSLIRQTWHTLKQPLKISLIVTVVLLTGPLLVAIGKEPSLLRDLLLLPDAWITPLEIGRAIIGNVGEIFWAREAFWPLGLGTLPLLDLFTAVMVALGLYHLDYEISRSLAYFVLVGMGSLLVLISLEESPTDSIVLLPFLYTLVAAGIVMLLSQWYEIFPRNPIARLTAFIPTALVLLAVVWYHQQRYFVAWPQTPDTITAFPALSRDITDTARHTDNPITIRVMPDETDIATAATKHMEEVTVTTEAIPTGEHGAVILSQRAYESLEASERQLLPANIKSVSTPYATAPISIWTDAAASEN